MTARATQLLHSDCLVGDSDPVAQKRLSTVSQLVHSAQSAFDMLGSRLLHSLAHMTGFGVVVKLQKASCLLWVQFAVSGRYTGK